MTNRYGIYQSSSKSCIFYKQDDDGNQSTFNIFITPKIQENDKEKIFAYIDNEQLKEKNWSKSEVSDIKDILEAFGGWASDAPIIFELEAHKSLSQCLSSTLKKEEIK